MKKLTLLIVVFIAGYMSYTFMVKKADTEVSDEEVVTTPMAEEKAKLSVIKEKVKEKIKGLEVEDEDIVAEKKWMSNIREIFEGELLDDPDAYDDYQSMKASFEEDRLDTYYEFMEQIKKEGKSFNITELEDGRYKELEEEYLKAFQKRYGQKVFLKYLEAKEKHNEANTNYPLYF